MGRLYSVVTTERCIYSTSVQGVSWFFAEIATLLRHRILGTTRHSKGCILCNASQGMRPKPVAVHMT